MAQEVHIRPARPDEATGIVDVVRCSIDPELLDFTIYGCDGIGRYVLDHILARGSGSDTTYTVACEGMHVIGCAEMRLDRDGLFLRYISVRPELRSRGLGGLLLLRAIEESGRGREGCIALDVFEHNDGARRWYDRLGFVCEGTAEWWEAPLNGAGPRREAIIGGYPQAMACHRRFGFGRFRVVTERGEYDVGLLGRGWFRLTSPEVLLDAPALGALRAVDDARRLLVIAPGEAAANHMPSGSRLVAVSHRLHSNINELARLLTRQVGI